MIVIQAGRASYYDGRKHHIYNLGEKAEVPQKIAQKWVNQGLAAWVEEPMPATPAKSYTGPQVTCSYQLMSMSDLRAAAKAQGLTVKRGMKKADLIDLLEGRVPKFEALEPEVEA